MDIIINDLKKSFGEKVAVNIKDFTIRGGEILGLVGNNGAGKSTLFRLILDLIKADEGMVRMRDTSRDINVAKTEEWKDWTGAYVDDSFLIDYLTPDEYFQFIAQICGKESEELQQFLDKFKHFMADEILGQKKYIRNLSAGNKQKVGIMAAMLLQPQILILDEPFNFLDPSSQSAIKHLLKKYNEETHATILVSSHNLQHTVDICPRIALLEHGIIIRDIDNHDGLAQRELEDYFQITD
jgi:ABC-2 type transport system ATP-binding protein